MKCLTLLITQIAEKVEVDKGKPQPQGESVSLDLLLLFQRLLLSLLYSASTEGDKGSHLDVPRTSFADTLLLIRHC